MSFTTHLMWITNRFNVIHVQISRQFWAEKVNDIDIKLIGRDITTLKLTAEGKKPCERETRHKC